MKTLAVKNPNKIKPASQNAVHSAGGSMGSPTISIGSAVLQSAISGVYERRDFGGSLGSAIHQIVVETVRLDVDGWYPQKMASGSFSGGLLHSGFVEWAAQDMVETWPGVWEGFINGKWGDTNLLPHNKVKILAPKGVLGVTPAELRITFLRGAPPVTRSVRFASPYFRTAEIEWDTVEGATRVTHINTADHPNRPSTLQAGPLTFIDVFSRAGVDLQRSTQESIVPLSLSDADEVGADAPLDQAWSDFELNEAMKKYWSRYQPRAQWAMWLLFAGIHEDPLTRGIMFDHQGVYKRQGAAAFNDWWLTDNETTNYDHRDAHIHRRRFVTACHETGHCFNLIHSWEHGAYGWWPLGDESLEPSFMNNPDNAPTTLEFFSNFEYSFSDRELRFIRHAPVHFIEMGGIRYGVDPADSARMESGTWSLQASVRRSSKVFDFMEPVVVDVTLTNRSNRPQVIDEGIFREGHNLNIAIRQGTNADTVLQPFVIRCLGPKWRVLQPGESLHHSAFASAGVRGWHISEPGPYEVCVRLNAGAVQALSDPLRLRVATPRERDEEDIAQDFFTDEVGRALVLGGAAQGTPACNVLEQIADRLRDRPLARHAQLSLGLPKMRAYKSLRLAGGGQRMSSVAADGGGIEIVRGKAEDARRLLEAALRAGDGVDTLGADYLARMTGRVRQWLDREGATPAKKVLSNKRRMVARVSHN
jgi:hypothetical protein